MNIKKFLSRVYSIISIVSTLLIFSGIIVYIYGHIINDNKSDNNLIMNQIREEIGEDVIITIDTVDIHGFGNNSIIVATRDDNELAIHPKNKNAYNNNLLIFDSINNEFLQDMNDLFGMKSSYKETFSYRIWSENIQFIPRTEYVLDIIGDSTKEIIVKYDVFGSTYGANGTAIFKYSYDEEQYELIGTYPNNQKLETNIYDKFGNSIGFSAKYIKTVFNDDSKDDFSNEAIPCKSQEKKFNLNSGSIYSQEYWAVSSTLGKVLVTVNIDKYRQQETYINVYLPSYNGKELSWSLCYSENVVDFPRNITYSIDDIAKALVEIVGYQVTIIQPYHNVTEGY